MLPMQGLQGGNILQGPHAPSRAQRERAGMGNHAHVTVACWYGIDHVSVSKKSRRGVEHPSSTTVMILASLGYEMRVQSIPPLCSDMAGLRRASLATSGRTMRIADKGAFPRGNVRW